VADLGEPVADAVRWLVAALAGAAPAEEVAARLAPRLSARGDVAAYFAGNRRFADFREHEPQIERLQPRGEWAAQAIIRTGRTRWELDVAVEPEPPHRIRSFQPRAAAGDGVELAALGDRRRTADRDEPAGSDYRLDGTGVVGLAAGVIRDGAVVYRGFRGLADLATGTPVDAHSVFRVGSVTKVVTALTVLRLAATGTVDLDAPPDRYLPARRLAHPPTVEQLLLHRGGLPKDALSRDGIRQAWPPGERAEYSNLGYQLLGALIEAVTGEPYASVVGREIFARYGMADASFGPPTVTGYRLVAGRVAPSRRQRRSDHLRGPAACPPASTIS
jgi:CubicO group peptidase (beta-lactamase class C family)